MESLYQRLRDDLRLRGRSPCTERSYLNCIRMLVRYFNACPSTLSAEQLRQYLLYLRDGRKLCAASLQSHATAIRFVLPVTLKRPQMVFEVISPPRPYRLPVVLSVDEMQALIGAARTPRARAMLMLLYGAGLRVGEMCALRVEDIDSKRRLIRVVQGKGNKTRQVMLSPRLLQALRDYWRVRPKTDAEWLILGPHGQRPVMPRTVARVIAQIASSIGITKRVTPHTLRHSFATHLVERGVDLRTVQLLLGHRSPSVTMRYVQLSNQHLVSTTSPLDELAFSLK
jgi:integrase/recombinase XerD